MFAYPSLVGKKLSDDPAYKYVIDTGCTRNLFRLPDTLKDVKPFKSVAVKCIIGKKYVEKIGVHRAIGKTFVASWAHASLISVPQMMSESAWTFRHRPVNACPR